VSRSSERYWLDRCKELERLTDQGCRVTAAELAKLYEQALSSIRERIRRLYGRFAEGYGVTPREAQELLSVAQTKQEREILRRMLEECDDPDLRAEILKKLDAPAYGYRVSRLEALQDQVYFDAKAVGVKEVKYDRGRLLDTYKTAYYRTTFNLSQSVGHNVPFERISDRRAARAIEQYWTPDPESLGQNFSQRVWNNTTELAENVREIVTEGLLTGGNYKDMADRLQAQMGDVSAQKVIQPDGSARTVLTGSGAKYRATRLIRTEGNHITGQAVLESYEDAGIEKYIYRSLLELRTCKRCGKLDGKRFPVKEQQVGVNMHPMHPNCRCFVVPDEPDEDLKDFTRSAQTGADNWEEVPANMSWEEWRKKYVDENPEMQAAERMEANRSKDRAQWKEYKAILGKNAPKNLAAFQKMKYTEPEKWTYTNGLKRYLTKYPSSDKRYFDVQYELEQRGIKKGVVLPPVQKQAFILPEGTRDPYHIMKRMAERHITDDDVRSYMTDAKAMFVQWGGERQMFVGENGTCIITKSDDHWLFKTAWQKYDNDEDFDSILEVMRNAGL